MEAWNRNSTAYLCLQENLTFLPPLFLFDCRLTGKIIKCINVGSYNYLGFAENVGPCHDAAEETTKTLGVTTCSPRLELGKITLVFSSKDGNDAIRLTYK